MKVAIYTGRIPSTTFIENLIISTSMQGVKIYIYGSLNEKYQCFYDKNVFLFIRSRNRFKKLFNVIFQFLFLTLKTPSDLIILMKYYNKLKVKDSGGFLNWWSKVLPVILNKPDIFHLQWARSLNFWYFLKDKFNIKLVLSLRGAHINYSPLYDINLKNEYLELFPKVDYFHAVCRAISVEASKYGASLSNISVINSPIDIDHLKRIKITSQKKNKTFKFISVGRSHWKKGYHYSLHAFKKVILDRQDVTYEIILSNSPSEELLFLTNDLGLTDKVIFSKSISQKNIYKKIKSSNCLILPSVEEGIANVVFESMALSTPIITSDCGGMLEIITNNRNGLVFKSRDIKDLSKSMIKIINMNRISREKMITNAFNYVSKNNNFFLIGSKMKKLYLNVIDE